MEAQQTQKTASVSSVLEDRTFRNITDISRRHYTRKPSKVVMELCTCCAKTWKAVNFYWDFFRGWVVCKRKCLDRFRARSESLEYLGKALRYASSASSGSGSGNSEPSDPCLEAVRLGSPLKEIDFRVALHAKYSNKPPGISTAARNTSACTAGFAIFPLTGALGLDTSSCIAYFAHGDRVGLSLYIHLTRLMSSSSSYWAL